MCVPSHIRIKVHHHIYKCSSIQLSNQGFSNRLIMTGKDQTDEITYIPLQINNNRKDHK